MKFIIKHETKGRMRIHLAQNRMTCKQADIFQYYMEKSENVFSVKVYEFTCDAAICFSGSREELIRVIKAFHYETVQVPENVTDSSGRELNHKFREQLTMKVLLHFGRKLFLPKPVRIVYTVLRSAKYIYHGLRCLSKRRLEVPVLDATAITVSMLRGDFDTANSVMFLLGIGEILEDWTHKKSVSDLARSMSLNISSVWLLKDGQEILVPSEKIQKGDEVVVHMGNVIPFDGDVTAGEGMVNQSSMTGESMPVKKEQGGYVYAGTVVEEGELTVKVRAVSGGNRYEKIVTMIEDSEKLKSGLESKAEHLADRLVPYTLLGTGLAGLLTRNVTKALSVLMVDFSCALKLAMPIAVLSAIREAGGHHMTVKGGKYLEAIAEASTIVFDKTGTLTNARPVVKDVVTFDRRDPDEMLRIAACLEEHFPHSMAKAVVDAAKSKNLEHEEMHSKVDYIVAHGISSFIENKKVIIGSYHFVFEDEKCVIPEGEQEIFDHLSPEYSHLYLAIEQRLAAVICIEDPIREEAAPVIRMLKASGINKIVMMTGDSERTAAAIARQVGIDEYYSEVLPEDKAAFVENEKKLGRKVIMVGDGINDSPALSAASVGIAISDGAQIAREIADITISANDLNEIVTLKRLSDLLMARIQKNYRRIVVINTALILLGVGGVIMPTTSALLHNMSTLIISLRSMENLLETSEN
ncbi:MAG TPA: heavy metal translocating P-type ATPase [Candidatus Scybalocola faecigallinarum]|uniref:Cd(2+)-exporting ATPase n=1 Tax=Candidatus Scybalocola faecigallinarum TaxID=2840941 RepID=A0A9D1JRD3_9FIRM|nr:heavy metal translocating P-type ATPase [Candidatus Scybalocola faecigallinarum]